MYVKIDGQLKTIKRIELMSDSKTILLHIETETGTEKVYNCPSESPNYYHLRKLLSSEIYIPSDIVYGIENFVIWMTLTLLNIDSQQQIILSITFNNITEEIKIITESTNDDQVTAFICTPESSHYSFIETSFKNPPPVLIKSQNGKFWMTTIFLDIND